MVKTKKAPAKFDISTLSSAECQTRLDEIAVRGRQIKERMALIRPPRPPRPAPENAGASGWTPPDPLEGAGPEYRAAVLDGSPQELMDVEQERDTLSSEATQLAFRADALRTRKRVAEEEERVAAAPGITRRIVEGFDDALADREEAHRALKAAEERVDEMLRDYGDARSALGDDRKGVAFFTPDQLRRLWIYPTGEMRKVMVGDPITGTTAIDRKLTRQVRQLLEPPSPGLIKRLMEGWAPSRNQLAEFDRAQEEKIREREWAEAQVLAIAQGEELDD